MFYTADYRSPLGDSTLASDGQALTGLWFNGQKHFGSTLGSLASLPAQLPVFDDTRRWLDIYFSGREPDFIPPLSLFETVFSADDKLDFIRRAKQAGFFIRLFFVCTESPMINAARIAGRVMKGGHDVPIAKIISRYQKSIINCKLATGIADRVYIYDNSVDGQEARILFRFSEGAIVKHYTDDIPQWAQVLL